MGTFSNEANAQRLQKRLQREGLAVSIRTSTAGGKTHHQVRVGPLPDALEAQLAAERVRSLVGLDAVITKGR